MSWPNGRSTARAARRLLSGRTSPIARSSYSASTKPGLAPNASPPKPALGIASGCCGSSPSPNRTFACSPVWRLLPRASTSRTSGALSMWGRGLRSSTDTGKTDCILLDHSGNIRRFYDDFVEVYFNGFHTLDDAEKLDASPRPEQEDFIAGGCPSCGHKPFHRRCLSCGFEKVTTALVDEQAGEMQEIRIGKKVIAPDAENLWAQLCTYAKGSIRSEKKAGWCWHKFREITGTEVPRHFPRFEEAPIVGIHPGTVSKLKQL